MSHYILHSILAIWLIGVDWDRPDALQAIRDAFRRVDDSEIELPLKVEAAALEYEILGTQLKELKEQRDMCSGVVLEAMKTARFGILPSGGRISRTLVDGGHVSYERKPYVTWRIKK